MTLIPVMTQFVRGMLKGVEQILQGLGNGIGSAWMIVVQTVEVLADGAGLVVSLINIGQGWRQLVKAGRYLYDMIQGTGDAAELAQRIANAPSDLSRRGLQGVRGRLANAAVGKFMQGVSGILNFFPNADNLWQDSWDLAATIQAAGANS